MDTLEVKIDRTLSDLFEKYIKEHGITYSHVARKSKLDVSYIRRMCLGQFPIPEKTRSKMNEILGTQF